MSLCPFPTTIIITPRAPPKITLPVSSQRIPLMHLVQLRQIRSIRVSSVEDLVIIEVCIQPEMLRFKCKKEGHFSKMCRSNPKIISAATCSLRLATMLISNTISASLGSLKKKVALYVLVGKNGAGTALMNKRSSGSFISLDYVRKHRLQMEPAGGLRS